MKIPAAALLAIPVVAGFAPTAPKELKTALSSSYYGRDDAFSQFPGTQTRSRSPFSNSAADQEQRSGMAVSRDGPLSQKAKNMQSDSVPVKVQGNTLKTWSFQTPFIDRVQVMMRTEGRPLNANVDLWQGPDNSPQRIAVYIEDADSRPFNAIIETPGGQNAVAIRNTNTMEFPLEAIIDAEVEEKPIGLRDAGEALASLAVPRTVQGGAVYTKPFNAAVQSVQLLLKTDGRPLTARIELLQGPNNSKQVMEIYSEDGAYRPFFIIIETPGSGNVIRVVNTATMEFPLAALIEPYVIDDSIPEGPYGDGSFFVVN